MDESQNKSEGAVLIATVFVKGALIFWLFFLYVAVMWFWDSQNIITKLTGASALIITFTTLFMPVTDKYFKRMLVFIVGFSGLFYFTQWI